MSEKSLKLSTYDGFSDDLFSLSSESITWKPDGLRFYVVSHSVSVVLQYDVAVPFDYNSTVTFLLAGLVGSPPVAGARCVRFDDTGTKVMLLGDAGILFEFTLSVAWDVSTGVYLGINYDISALEPNPKSFSWNGTGTKIFIVGDSAIIHELIVASPYDITSPITNTGNTFSVAANEPNPLCIGFYPDGTSLYILGGLGIIFEYKLSAAFSLGGSISFLGEEFSVVAEDSNQRSFEITPDGTKFFLIGSANDMAYQYSYGEILEDNGLVDSANLCIDFDVYLLDILEKMRNRLLWQFGASPVIDQILQALACEVQELYDAGLDVLRKRTLCEATGVQQDVIGRIVGQDRILLNAEKTIWFGPDSVSVNIVPPDSGPVWVAGADLTGDIPATDSEYLNLILSKIFKNHIQGASNPELTIYIELLLQEKVSFQIVGPCDLRLYVSTNMPTYKIETILQIQEDSRTAEDATVIPLAAGDRIVEIAFVPFSPDNLSNQGFKPDALQGRTDFAKMAIVAIV